jgi:hypothetical protein
MQEPNRVPNDVDAVKEEAALVPATVGDRAKYIAEIAGGMTGRPTKFDIKTSKFITADDGSEVPDAEYIALCPETLAGYIKFNGPGTPPDREMGLLYGGFVMPTRESLGDTDESKWEANLDGRPSDPWKHQIALPLMNATTQELFVFTATSDTGRRAVGRLLQHYERMLRLSPDDLPIVRLKAGGFNHRDSRVGWVPTPNFAIVGKTTRAAEPSYFSDRMPF